MLARSRQKRLVIRVVYTIETAGSASSAVFVSNLLLLVAFLSKLVLGAFSLMQIGVKKYVESFWGRAYEIQLIRPGGTAHTIGIRMRETARGRA